MACDLLIEGTNTSGEPLLVGIETKFVEPEFSVCGFKKSGRAEKDQDVCPDDVAVRADRGACLYVRNKGYGYWRRSDEHGPLIDVMSGAGPTKVIHNARFERRILAAVVLKGRTF